MAIIYFLLKFKKYCQKLYNDELSLLLEEQELSEEKCESQDRE